MNGYDLSRQWFDFSFENPDLITVTQTALYMWLIEVNNRRGFSSKFTFNTEDAIIAIGVSDRKTIWVAMNGLIKNGFVTMIFKSKNQHKPSVISIINNKVKSGSSLNKALLNLSEFCTSNETANGQAQAQHSNSTPTPNGHSYKPQTTNHKPQINNAIAFASFWDLYGKKKDTAKCEKKWDTLSLQEKEIVMRAAPVYIRGTPDLKFRKNPLTWLNGKCWLDEPAEPKNTTNEVKPLENNNW